MLIFAWVHMKEELGNQLLKTLNIILAVLLFVSFILLSSCAAVGKYDPDPKLVLEKAQEEPEEDQFVKPKPKEAIHISNAVKLSNAQSNNQDRNLDFRGIIVNYQSFTQAVVDGLTLEYKANKVSVSDSAEKQLQIKVVDINMTVGGVNFRADVVTEVSYGNGKTERFEASRASYASPLMMNHFPTKPLDSAFQDIVEKIARNKNILAYLNN